jgi:hypothetical protein
VLAGDRVATAGTASDGTALAAGSASFDDLAHEKRRRLTRVAAMTIKALFFAFIAFIFALLPSAVKRIDLRLRLGK